jgi:hypothetical protein
MSQTKAQLIEGSAASELTAAKTLLGAGSASAPSLTAIGDTNTGVFFPTADTIGFAEGGVEAMRLDSSGRLGLGSSAPQEIFEVRKDSAGASVVGALFTNASSNANTAIGISFSPNLSGTTRSASIYGVNETASQSATALTFHTNANGASQTEKLRITSTGAVGIGTTSPSVNGKLTVANADQLGICFVNTDSSNKEWRIAGVSTSLAVIQSGVGEALRVDNGNRLLVGTSSARSNFYNASFTPNAQIESASGNATYLSIVSNANSSVGESGIILGKTRGTAVGQNTAVQSQDLIGYVSFQGSDGSELVSAAAIYAEVDGTPGANDMPGRIVLSTTADGASSPTERMRIDNLGRIFTYNANTGNNSLTVASAAGAGTAVANFIGAYGATAVNTGTSTFIVWTNGDVANTNNVYGAISDIKLKENIADANSQWDDLKALQVRNYNFKEGQTHTQIGLIAQEVELVSPGLVTESPDRDEEGNDLGTVTKSVNYSVLYMKAVKALQEAMERIEQLETEMAEVKAQLQAS